ncbi:MAG: FprA family A-type flavoprotein [Clostridia bacterium]|nr:FprA family A-type flavoprotein [Clostridia bacterium]MDR3643605.1 FprA family A-type flavoprotein [Clostridia bacterium]
MPAVKLAENVYWVGATDWDIRVFHGYKVPFGTSYNAYLVLDKKVTLIDTVKAPFVQTLIDNISELVDPAKIDYLISNHAEPDHSGSLPRMAEIAKNAPVIADATDQKTLKTYYKRDFNFQTVSTGSQLNTGSYDFKFLQAPMVHWPDSMFTYLPQHRILFPNDAFGQHQATQLRFDDEVGREVTLARAKDYYANIVLPFGPQVQKALKDASAFDIGMIAPSHGVVWRSFVGDIVEKYQGWSSGKVDEKLAVIVYDSMWGTTAELARQIAADFAAQGIVSRLLSLTEYHVSECMDALMEAKYIAVGSPTLNRNLMPTVAGFLADFKGLAPKKRTGIAFGSYGWSGESVGIIERTLQESGLELLPSRKAQYRI